ncbi:hypothetical protein ACJMK2_024153 [Sinanodonta woodiana]|uniref:Protein kinase domain-containing protein n=1 Tax=Sinanodonta woodiana TaxID=1069815 RepID=A0ABD3T891_SINWO
MTWTPTYLAPEACRRVLPRYSVNRDEQITEKVDVFALGLTVLFMFEKQHALHKMRQVYCKDLSTNKKEKQNFYLCYAKPCFFMFQLANWTEPPHDLFPKECSVKVKHLLTGMLSGSQDRRFSAEVGLAFIESFEVNQKECQHTQNGRLVTHPIENHQDAGAMSAIHGGVIDLNKVKLQNKKRKNIKESEVLEGGTDVLAMAETGRQNPRMETSLKSRSVNPTIQALERATGAGLTAQNFTQRYQANILSRKPERWKHKAERRQHPYKKMKQPVFGDSTPHVSLLPGPAIPNSVSSHMIDGEMKPGMGDDISPCIRMQQSQLGKSALDNQ